MPQYITTYDMKPPTTETKSAPAVTVPVETSTATEVAKAFFGGGPVYTHGAAGLVATTDADRTVGEERVEEH